ncbi:dipeptidase [Bacillaceae bacterium Marseille-Q3522]|nr:dipeptidase [Bacillaceae bacterium Marseille-Q3522]
MKIIDLHCDVLLKLSEGNGRVSFARGELHASKANLQKGEVKVQCFAIFIPPDMPIEEKFGAALGQIAAFYQEVLGKNPQMKQIKEWHDFESLQDGEIGAMLTLEGVDAIGNDLGKLDQLYQLGVRSVGLTWNNANLAADGAGEARGAGLTAFGKEIVQFLNNHQMYTDVAHLSEKGFWDVMETAVYPIASHANAKKLCNHPRNLSDEQAKALFANNGLIHVVYMPDFVKEGGQATIDDLIRHIDHFASLGGIKHIGLGSDFDGISRFVEGLEDASKSQNLINELLKRFSEDEVKGIAHQNFLDHRPHLRDKLV